MKVNVSQNNPKELIYKWRSEQKTIESLDLNSNVATTEEKSDIRQERLDIFMPNLKREYSGFIYRLRLSYLLKWLKSMYPITIILGLYVFWKSIKFTVGGFKGGQLVQFLGKKIDYFATVHNSNTGVEMLFLLLELVLAFVGPIIIAVIVTDIISNIPYLLLGPQAIFSGYSKRKYYRSTEYILEKSPYIEAFFLGNGFVKCPLEKDEEGSCSEKIPKEIVKLNFDQFINYVRKNYEPLFSSYTNETKYGKVYQFDSLFFYLNEESMQQTFKTRESIQKNIAEYGYSTQAAPLGRRDRNEYDAYEDYYKSRSTTYSSNNNDYKNRVREEKERKQQRRDDKNRERKQFYKDYEDQMIKKAFINKYKK